MDNSASTSTSKKHERDDQKDTEMETGALQKPQKRNKSEDAIVRQTYSLQLVCSNDYIETACTGKHLHFLTHYMYQSLKKMSEQPSHKVVQRRCNYVSL